MYNLVLWNRFLKKTSLLSIQIDKKEIFFIIQVFAQKYEKAYFD